MNRIAGLYNRRFRGFRIINFFAVVLLLVMMFGLYWAKTRASGDSAAITRIDHQIISEKRDIRLLEAQVAGLEQPERIGKLSQDYLHVGALKASQEITPDKLASLGKPQASSAKPAAPPTAQAAPVAVAQAPAAAPPAAQKLASR